MAGAAVEERKDDGLPPPAEVAAAKQPYYAKRIELFEKYRARMDAAVEAAKVANVPITITLPDGKTKPGVKGVTTPMDVALSIAKSVAKDAVVASVDGDEWDLTRPLEGDCKLALHTFEDPEGKHTYWHSSSHVLGEALELEYGADLTIGPALEEGFYYDCFLGERNLGDADKPALKKRMETAIKEKQNFQRIEVSRDEALGMFLENKFKVELIENLPAEARITCYRCGPMVDLCSGPHLPNTGYMKAVEVNQTSRSHWRADVKKDALVRVYAITFPDKKMMAEYVHRIEEAKKRDHRNVGVAQDLFFFHPLSPGSCFFYPNGARIYNNLIGLMREKYWEYEYDEVVSPNVYNFDLWKTSGHADHYRENMFAFDVEKAEFGLKPMNCPGHCVMFGERLRTFRDLPMRYADFGVLHRNEFSGALSGLTRVRRFQQDDAHIFCRPDQMEVELSSFLKLMDEVYTTFGLDYTMELSTRPDDFLGEVELWDTAEGALTNVLNATGRPWNLNPGDGAFYGPKIDIKVLDCLKRSFQCATVQLDFQLPIRFNLSYIGSDQAKHRPVIIHRAVLGSVERMLAILTEHFAGKWPLWLSPRQVMVVPISDKSYAYADQVRRAFRAHKLHSQADLSDRKMQKKVREAQIEQWNYILVVGEEEAKNGTVNVRTRDNKVHGEHSVEALAAVLVKERDTYSIGCLFDSDAAAAAAAAGRGGAGAGGAAPGGFPTAAGGLAPRWCPDGSGKGTHVVPQQ